MNGDSQKKLDLFFARFKTINLRKRETFLRPGDVPSGIYYLTHGYVRLCSICEDGQELTLVIYKPGDFFPVVWAFYGGGPSIYSFETFTAAQVRKAPREEFIKFMENNSEVFLEVTKHIITRFQISLRRMEYLTFGTASSQLASILLIYSKEFAIKKGNEIEIQIPFTHKDLASLVGVTRETVSIEIKRFERKGIIGYNGKNLIIKNKEKLEKEAILV